MVSLRIAKCYFIIGNIVFKQEFVISMGIDPAPHWANLFLYFLKSKYVQLLISKGSPRAFKVPWDINVYRQPLHNKWWWWVFFLSPRAFKVPWDIRFAEEFCTINDGGEFSSSDKYNYPKQLEIKPEHQGEHATFLDFEIPIQDNIFVCKLFEKRNTFPLFIINMPYFSSNIPSSVFCGSIFSGFQSIGN